MEKSGRRRGVTGFEKVAITRWDPAWGNRNNIIHRFPLDPSQVVHVDSCNTRVYTVEYTWVDAVLGACLPTRGNSFFVPLPRFAELSPWKKVEEAANRCSVNRPFFPVFPPVHSFLSSSSLLLSSPLCLYSLFESARERLSWVISLGFHDNAEC